MEVRNGGRNRLPPREQYVEFDHPTERPESATRKVGLQDKEHRSQYLIQGAMGAKRIC